MNYWSALDILKQTCGELGLSRLTSYASNDDDLAVQMVSLLNAAGNELLTYYPWEQFTAEWEFVTVVNQGEYALPSDYLYFKDQTQWDRTNHWPLLGPKTAAEWAWVKGSLVAPLPRLRYRVKDNKFVIYPTPTDPGFTPLTLSMEYVRGNWVLGSGTNPQAMVLSDGDIVQFAPWLIIKFLKLKFYELKGLDLTAFAKDFMRVYEGTIGRDTGAPVLSLVPVTTPQYIGPYSIPDGSWNVGS